MKIDIIGGDPVDLADVVGISLNKFNISDPNAALKLKSGVVEYSVSSWKDLIASFDGPKIVKDPANPFAKNPCAEITPPPSHGWPVKSRAQKECAVMKEIILAWSNGPLTATGAVQLPSGDSWHYSITLRPWTLRPSGDLDITMTNMVTGESFTTSTDN
jgi:hypothetical protein